MLLKLAPSSPPPNHSGDIMYSDNYDYAVRRLVSTFIRHKGEVVYVHGISKKFEVSVQFPDETMSNVSMSDIELEPIRLGFVNYDKEVGHISRIPARKYQQGLSYDNSEVVWASDKGLPGPRYLQAKFLTHTHKGIFPSYGEALEKGKAFSRSFAAYNEKLFYKGKLVGAALETGPFLAPRYEYLQNNLNRSLSK